MVKRSSTLQNREIMKIDKVWFDENNIYFVIDSGHTI